MSDFIASPLGLIYYNITWRTRTPFVVISLFFLSTKFHRTFSILTLVVVALNLLYATKPLHGGDEKLVNHFFS
jgi:hypothetical protein